MSNEQYRELKEGEIVQEGDQVKIAQSENWISAHYAIGGTMRSWDVGTVRRPIPIPEVTESANMQNELLLACKAVVDDIESNDYGGEISMATLNKIKAAIAKAGEKK